jgi:hypothetical protein
MKNIILIMFLSLPMIGNYAHAQSLSDIKGDALKDNVYIEVEGNPYLFNDWVNGTIVLAGNQSIPAPLKFDICTNQVLFQNKAGETLALKSKITSFTLDNTNTENSDLKPMVFVNGYPATAKQTESSYYQLVGDGKTRLLKFYRKSIDEQRAYASATTIRSFKYFQVYYVFKNNQLIEVQPNKKSITKVLDEHPAQLEVYLKDHNISLKSDADLQKLFTWYNSLN